MAKWIISAFKLPLNLASNDIATCNISKGSGLRNLLKMCWMIFLDECPMSHKAAFEALDRTLQDIRNCRAIMVGVTLVLSGDFRQTLTVIARGTRVDELKACLKSSHLWQSVKKLRLTTNMRAQLRGDQLSGQFATDLLTLGDGRVPVGTKWRYTHVPVRNHGGVCGRTERKSLPFSCPKLQESQMVV